MTTRLLQPAPIVLASIITPGNLFLQHVPFIVPTPDARLSVRVSVIFQPDPSYWTATFPDIWGEQVDGSRVCNYSLWLAAAVRDSGSLLPVTNLLGCRQVPAWIPVDPLWTSTTLAGGLPPAFSQSGPGVLGYSQTVVADCDAVIGDFLAQGLGNVSIPPYAGRWVLSTRYQGIVPMCDDEWNAIVPHCTPALTGSPLVVP
jgi:hypothetical protein